MAAVSGHQVDDSERKLFRSKLLVSYGAGMPKSHRPRPGDPPLSVTTFVGRARLIRRVIRRLGTARLLTLLGTGAIGKTRLAQQVTLAMSRKVIVRWVQLVDLEPTTDALILVETVAYACGVRDFSAGTPWNALIECLTTGDHLLVLDNAEHVSGPLGAVVSDLLAAVPTVQILVTSRQPLGCDGEHQLPVPPLAPDEAWDLLVDRAKALGVVLTDHDRATGTQLCQRLDGIPLAIELAAQRLLTMPIQELLAGVDDRLRLLTGGPRHGGHPTHTSLRAVIGWSWDLCTPAEQTLWARCSIFPVGAGWDLAAATHICADRTGHDPNADSRDQLNQPAHHDEAATSTIQGEDVLDVLDGLVNKQIVTADTTGTHTRYRMLETLRLYGHEVLHQHGDAAGLWTRHNAYYRARTQEAARFLYSADEVGWNGPKATCPTCAPPSKPPSPNPNTPPTLWSSPPT